MMNQEDLFKKIGLIVKELNVQYEYLAQNPQQLNELELALFHANADFLSDHAQILIKISKNQAPLEIQAAVDNQESEIEILQGEDRKEELETEYYGDALQEEQVEAITFAEEIPEIEEEIFKLDESPSTFEFILNESSESETIESIPQTNLNPFVQDSFITDESPLNNDEKFDFEEKSVDELFNRPLSQEEENILAQKRKLRETITEAPVDIDEDEIGPEPFLVSKPIEEDFPIDEEDLTLEEAIEPVINNQQVAVEDPSYKPTLNDLLAVKTDKSLNDHNGANRISDLKQGINLNDKLLYIKDLFNGYNLAYAEAIDLANKLSNFEAADNFFKKNYAVKYNWADKQTTVDKFYALLNQRFK
ncbi:MAG: hypothetical protein V4663_18605 [Bacteroidota bacterium]